MRQLNPLGEINHSQGELHEPLRSGTRIATFESGTEYGVEKQLLATAATISDTRPRHGDANRT